MLKSFFAITGLVAGLVIWSPPVTATVHNQSAFLACELRANLVPEAQYFWRYGRDQWNGPGIIGCVNNSQTRSKRPQSLVIREMDIIIPIQVRFDSWISGMGTPPEAQLQILITNISHPMIKGLFGSYRTYRLTPLRGQKANEIQIQAEPFLVKDADVIATVGLIVNTKAIGDWNKTYFAEIGPGQLIIQSAQKDGKP